MKGSFKEKKGITLIALVITIIVLLILVGVSIAMLTGQNGILSRAAEAKKNTEMARIDEEEKLKENEDKIEELTGEKTGGKTAAELFDSTGEEEGKLHIGDFVNYTLGDWTDEDMAKIVATGAKVEANKTNENLPDKAYQFGGFAVGDSKSGNAKSSVSDYAYLTGTDGKAITGWRVFDVTQDGTLILISAGCPEDYYISDYYWQSGYHKDGFIGEYILTGNKNSNATYVDFSLYTPRDWSMYENTNLNARATALNKEKLDKWYTKYITDGREANIEDDETFQKIYETKYENLIDNYSFYWLAFAPNDGYSMYKTSPSAKRINTSGEGGGAYGVRILISVPSSILVDDTTNNKTVISRGHSYNYKVWNIK